MRDGERLHVLCAGFLSFGVSCLLFDLQESADYASTVERLKSAGGDVVVSETYASSSGMREIFADMGAPKLALNGTVRLLCDCRWAAFDCTFLALRCCLSPAFGAMVVPWRVAQGFAHPHFLTVVPFLIFLSVFRPVVWPLHGTLRTQGGKVATELARALAPGGTLVTYGSATPGLTVPASALTGKDLTLRGFSMERWLGRASRADAEGMVAALADAGVASPSVSKVKFGNLLDVLGNVRAGGGGYVAVMPEGERLMM